MYVLFPFFSYQRICPTFSKLDPMKCERRAGGCGSSKLMKMTLFSGSFPNGWHFCKLPHCQPHKLTTEGRGEGIDLVPFRSPPPQQIKTKEFQFPLEVCFQKELPLFTKWFISKKSQSTRFKIEPVSENLLLIKSICTSVAYK